MTNSVYAGIRRIDAAQHQAAPHHAPHDPHSQHAPHAPNNHE